MTGISGYAKHRFNDWHIILFTMKQTSIYNEIRRPLLFCRNIFSIDLTQQYNLVSRCEKKVLRGRSLSFFFILYSEFLFSSYCPLPRSLICDCEGCLYGAHEGGQLWRVTLLEGQGRQGVLLKYCRNSNPDESLKGEDRQREQLGRKRISCVFLLAFFVHLSCLIRGVRSPFSQPCWFFFSRT